MSRFQTARLVRSEKRKVKIGLIFKKWEASVQYNFCRLLDLNRGPMVSEAIALPTEPQPLPKKCLF